jgi:glycerol-3-phosphate dehydrogenase
MEKTFNKCVGFLGYGEIGSSLHQVYKDFPNIFEYKIKDINKQINDDFKNVEILNICIPLIDQNKFIDIIKNTIKDTKIKLIIIHSSIPPGTTKLVISKIPNIHIVNSPCRGVHPNLKEGLKTFVK